VHGRRGPGLSPRAARLIYENFVRPLLFRVDPETVHEWAVRLSRAFFALPPVEACVSQALRVDDPVELSGVRFPNRIGLAAGFDKNGYFIPSAQALGFGHLEVGAITPRPQSGHPRPRLFRVPGKAALRNRMGFNNQGVEAIFPRLPATRGRIVVGINLGKGLDTPLENAHEDYLAVLRATYPRADYFSINISSPNTANLRQLGSGETLRSLCRELVAGNVAEAERRRVRRLPLWIKISPDSTPQELDELATVALESGLDGIVATNTTVRRDGSYSGIPDVGGLSGAPLTERSLEVVAQLRHCVGPGVPLVGVGGVLSEKDALAMRAAGADLVQIYTGFIYGGPLVPRRLAAAMKGAK
jgi:dihydroorotate dehydrogenase